EAPHELRGITYNVVWDCPRCSERNDYRGVKLELPEDQHAVRLTCRGCLSRFDIRTPAPIGTSDVGPSAGSPRCWLFKVGRTKLERFAKGKFGWRNAGKALAAARTLFNGLRLLRSPFDPNRHVAYGRALEREGAVGMAILHYKQALRLDRDHPPAARR